MRRSNVFFVLGSLLLVALLVSAFLWVRLDRNTSRLVIREQPAIVVPNNVSILPPGTSVHESSNNMPRTVHTDAFNPNGGPSAPTDLAHPQSNLGSTVDTPPIASSSDGASTAPAVPMSNDAGSLANERTSANSDAASLSGERSYSKSDGDPIQTTPKSAGGQSSKDAASKDTALSKGANQSKTSADAADSQSNKSDAESKPVAFGSDGSAKLTKSVAHKDWNKSLPVAVVVDKKRNQTYLLQSQDKNVYIVFDADNAIGTEQSPTPPGPYKVASKEEQPEWTPPKSIDPKQKKIGPYKKHKDNPLGVAAIKLNKWSIVLHGTNNESSIGKKSSHGCIRHRNKDIKTLYSAVEKGTTVIVVDSIEGTKITKDMFVKPKN